MSKKVLTEPYGERSNGAVHGWFSLTRANYLVLQRALLQEMPTEWQERFIACIEEIRDFFDCAQMEDNYTVLLRDKNGKFKEDPLGHYRRPNHAYIDSIKWSQDQKEAN